MTIQPSLFVCLDDELGELDEDQQTFVRVCSWAKVLLHLKFSLIVIAAEQICTNGTLA